MTETASRPTLEAVAARAGVSRATASRVVNGGDGVREPLVERVRRAVEELGYVPNQAARSLVTRRHDAVAVVIAEPETRVFADPFFALQLRGISKELTAHDSQLVLLLTEGRDDHARVGRYLAGGHVDGALVFSCCASTTPAELIHGAGVPTVFGGRPGWATARGGPSTSTATTGAAPARPYAISSDSAAPASRRITGALDQTSPPSTGSTASGTSGATPIRASSSRATSRPRAASVRCASCWSAARTSTRCSRRTT